MNYFLKPTVSCDIQAAGAPKVQPKTGDGVPVQQGDAEKDSIEQAHTRKILNYFKWIILKSQ